MKFLRKKKVDKTVIVVSDVHLGAGDYVQGMRNYLEDFHYDDEFIEFLEYFSSGEYQNREVELIINGDFFDLLAVPYVKFYDDEYWSEDAAKEKLRLILDAHPEVMEAVDKFVSFKDKKITYIIGNHDAELVFSSLQEMVLEKISSDNKERFEILLNEAGEYRPFEQVCLKHGHEYELAHQFDPEKSIIEREDGKKFFNAPWGSYYVIRVINKYKEERDHVNAVRPINKFLINGMIYDTFFTLRFMLANAFYFVMVRTIVLYKQSDNFMTWLTQVFSDLELFQNYETLTYDYLDKTKDTDILIVGHTHEPIHRVYPNGKTFINTGTWTRMFHLDFGKGSMSEQLTFAKIDQYQSRKGTKKIVANLHTWKGTNHLPYNDFN